MAITKRRVAPWRPVGDDETIEQRVMVPDFRDAIETPKYDSRVENARASRFGVRKDGAPAPPATRGPAPGCTLRAEGAP